MSPGGHWGAAEVPQLDRSLSVLLTSWPGLFSALGPSWAERGAEQQHPWPHLLGTRSASPQT